MKKQYPYDSQQSYLVAPHNQLESYQEISSSDHSGWSTLQYALAIIGIGLVGGFLLGLVYSLFLGLNQGITLGLIHGLVGGSIWSFIWLLKWSE